MIMIPFSAILTNIEYTQTVIIVSFLVEAGSRFFQIAGICYSFGKRIAVDNSAQANRRMSEERTASLFVSDYHHTDTF